MGKLCGEVVHAPANARAEPHRLVCQTKAEPVTAAQETEQGASQSSPPVGTSILIPVPVASSPKVYLVNS